MIADWYTGWIFASIKAGCSIALIATSDRQHRCEDTWVKNEITKTNYREYFRLGGDPAEDKAEAIAALPQGQGLSCQAGQAQGLDAAMNIREVLSGLEGQSVVGITQHDDIDYLCGVPAFFCLHFSGGSMLRIVVIEEERVYYLEAK